MPEQEQKQIGIRLDSINILETNIDFPADAAEPDSGFTFAVNAECTASIPDETVLCVVTIGIGRIDGTKKIGSITVGFVFLISPFEELIMVDESKKVRVPKNIVDFVNPLSISTTRGIMFTTFKGTFLHNAILPILDPSLFSVEENVKEDI